MTEGEIEEFLSGPVICRLGCLDETGWPYVVPVWMQYADGNFYLVPRERSRWAASLQRDGRCSLCMDVFEEHRRVLVKGNARIVEEPNIGGSWVPILEEMAERYWGARGRRYWRETLDEPRWLIQVETVAITSWYGTWAQRYRHYDWSV
ncbi:MAG: pyridoxamine 5'-phosphate oxidase family protein [Thermomicrobiales bacterium]